MYLNEHDGLSGIGRSLKKRLKKVRKVVKKVANLNPVYAAQRRAARPAIRGFKKANPLVALTRGALDFRPRNTPAVAPVASVPVSDYDGTDYTAEERNAEIDDSSPRMEPYASGYPSPEETFGPDVPDSVTPEEIEASEVQPETKKKFPLPLLGGLLLLLNFM